MTRLKVNTTQVVTTAGKIKNLNNQMRDGFSDVQRAMSNLNSAWDGSASSSAIAKFNSIKNAYCTARYDVLDNYVAFLNQQVGAGYDQTETTNKSLAAQFK